MKFYEKYYRSNYEELITYYPRYYRNVFEMVEILKAFGRAADTLEKDIEQTYFNNFILTADTETIKVWEDILEITYKEKLTLDQRKRVVIARIMGYGHIGEPEIREIIAKYTENAVEVDFKNGVIFLTIAGNVFDETNLRKTILRRIPAHLALNMKIHIQRTFRMRLPVGYMGAVGTECRSNPVSEDRTSRAPLTVSWGGFSTSKQTGIPPSVERALTGRTEGAKGVYCRTHIKSKRIE